MFNNNVSVGSSMTNFKNNHRIMCVDIRKSIPIYFGFIGTELVKTNMRMGDAIMWLNNEPEARDTICPVCKQALFTLPTVIAANGVLYCSKRCARKRREFELQEEIQHKLNAFIDTECEEVSTDTIGIR